MKIAIFDANGKQLQLHPLVLAMMRVIVKSQEAIIDQREAVVELHYVTDRCKVSGKLKHHIGLERTDAEAIAP